MPTPGRISVRGPKSEPRSFGRILVSLVSVFIQPTSSELHANRRKCETSPKTGAFSPFPRGNRVSALFQLSRLKRLEHFFTGR